MNRSNLSELVSAEQIAEAVGVSVKTIRRWNERGLLPAAKRYGRRLLRWNKTEIENWMMREGINNDQIQPIA